MQLRRLSHADFLRIFLHEMNISEPFPASMGRRDLARHKVLEALRASRAMPRAMLGRQTGLSPASISAITGQLIEEGTLIERSAAVPDGGAGPGRPGINLEFDPAIGVVIGLWVGLDRIVLDMTDYSGRPVASTSESLPLHDRDADDLVAILASRIRHFAVAAAGGRTVLGLGVSFQGFVDTHAGLLIWSPVVAGRNVAVRDALAQLTGLLVEIDNDAGAMAYALAHREPQLKNGIAACIMLGDGVGLGLLVNGESLRGSRGGGNEFGHVQIAPNGPQCRCGARGCVESYLADYALYRDAQALGDVSAAINPRQPTEAEMQALLARALAGDRGLNRLLAQSGRMLARGVATLIHLLQPGRIVFCGPGVRAWPLIEPAFREGLAEHAIAELSALTQLSVSPFEPSLLTEGVVLRMLQRVDRQSAARPARAEN